MATTPSSQGSSPSSGPTTPASGTRRGRELLHAAVVVEFGARFVRTGFGSESTPRAVARAPWAAEAVEFRGVSYEKAAAAAERAVDEMAARWVEGVLHAAVSSHNDRSRRRIHRTPLKGHKVVLVDREDNHAYVREAGIRRLLFKHEVRSLAPLSAAESGHRSAQCAFYPSFPILSPPCCAQSEYVRVIPTSAAICAAAGSPFGIAVDVGFRDTRIVPVAFGSPLRDCATGAVTPMTLLPFPPRITHPSRRDQCCRSACAASCVASRPWRTSRAQRRPRSTPPAAAAWPARGTTPCVLR